MTRLDVTIPLGIAAGAALTMILPDTSSAVDISALALAGAGLLLSSRSAMGSISRREQPLPCSEASLQPLPRDLHDQRLAMLDQVIRPVGSLLEALLLDLFRVGPPDEVRKRLKDVDRRKREDGTDWAPSGTTTAPWNERHRYEVTRVLAAYDVFRKEFPDAEPSLRWIARKDPRLWAAMTSLGRRRPLAAGAGAVCHYLAERQAGHPIDDVDFLALDSASLANNEGYDFAYDLLEHSGNALPGDEAKFSGDSPLPPLPCLDRNSLVAASACSLALPWTGPVLAGSALVGMIRERVLSKRATRHVPAGPTIVLGHWGDRDTLLLSEFERLTANGAGGILVGTGLDPDEFRALTRRWGREDDAIVIDGASGFGGNAGESLDLFSTFSPETLAEALAAATPFADAASTLAMERLLLAAIKIVKQTPPRHEDEFAGWHERLTAEIDFEQMIETSLDSRSSLSPICSAYLKSIPGYDSRRGTSQSRSVTDHHERSRRAIQVMLLAEGFPAAALASDAGATTTTLQDIVTDRRLVLVTEAKPSFAGPVILSLVAYLLDLETNDTSPFVVAVDMDDEGERPAVPSPSTMSSLLAAGHPVVASFSDAQVAKAWTNDDGPRQATLAITRSGLFAARAFDGRVQDDPRWLTDSYALIDDRGKRWKTLTTRESSTEDRGDLDGLFMDILPEGEDR